MKTKKLLIGTAIAGVLALGSIGFAAAQSGNGPANPWGMHGTMGDRDDMPGHTQMHEAMAKALGMTVAELDAQLNAGKTMPEIAAEKGIDLTTLHDAMQGAHPTGHMGAGMGFGTGQGTGPGAGMTPGAGRGTGSGNGPNGMPGGRQP